MFASVHARNWCVLGYYDFEQLLSVSAGEILTEYVQKTAILD